MKRYIKANTLLNQLDTQLKAYLGDNLISESDWYDGKCYIFIINDHNIYRVIVFPDQLIFQCTQYAIVDENGEFIGFDDAVDYNSDSGNPDRWFNLITTWIDECEADNPNFTIYEGA